jgi:AmmeMemoRadiSam system protein B
LQSFYRFFSGGFFKYALNEGGVVMEIRKAAFSGTWYPDGAGACEKEIKSFLKNSALPSAGGEPWVGGIVPHAGWYFSGAIACQVISALKQGEQLDTVAIFGMHLHPGSANYIMKKGAWETPFGPIEIDEELAQALIGQFDFVIETPSRFTQDNTIELQLPFVKYFFKDAKILPIGVPPTKHSLDIGKALVRACRQKGRSIKVIGSTDLTHYGLNYGFSPKGLGSSALKWVKEENDRSIIDSMLNLDPETVIQQALQQQNACCAGAAATAITAGKALGAQKAYSIAYATSHEKSPGDSFVGYVGIIF